MKQLFTLLTAVICLTGYSQTNNTGSFFQSFTGYFSSFNPALESTFDGKGSVFTSVDSIQGGEVPLANSLGVEYNLWKLISVESLTRNSGVAGTLVSEQIGLGLGFKVHDVKVTAYLDGGYMFNAAKSDKMYGEIGLRIFKALSEHTFAGIGIGAQVPGSRQVFSIYTGFTF